MIIQAPQTLNNRLILEKYQKQGLRADEESRAKGFAMIAQKTHLKGLRVLVGTKLSDGTIVPKDATAYIKEELLHTAPWATKVWTCEDIKGEFIIVDMIHVEFIA